MLPVFFQTLRYDAPLDGNSNKARTGAYYQLRANTGTHEVCNMGHYWTSSLASST